MAKKKHSISISYPPLTSKQGNAFLSQNRQFQWTHTDNVIYPVIPASAATLLKSKGFTVYWDDAIAEKLNFDQWLTRLVKRKPDFIAIETKTPVIKQHWQIIKNIRKEALKIKNWKLKIILMGDHVTALPEESKNKADHILIGGDYDLLLYHLLTNQKISLDQLPIIDRQLTNWQLYSKRNSNFKYKPGAYIMSARDCWWGQCSFCSWTSLFPHQNYRRFSVDHTIAEIKNLINLGAREIFDDSGTLPIGDWLHQLCQQIVDQKLNHHCHFGCNMRFNALSQSDYQLMGRSGFRLILYGLESANPKTIKKINKNIDLSTIKTELSWAKQAGLEPHITVMIGYPWENLKDARNTLNLARDIFRHGLADSIQATIIMPYPGTPLYDYCKKNKLLTTKDYNRFDMSQPVIKSTISPEYQKQLIQDLFKGVLTPNFLIKKVVSIRSLDDLAHLTNYALKFIKKLKDFS